VCAKKYLNSLGEEERILLMVEWQDFVSVNLVLIRYSILVAVIADKDFY